jgi:hypothetical protein
VSAFLRLRKPQIPLSFCCAAPVSSSFTVPMQSSMYCGVFRMRSLWSFLKGFVASFPATVWRTIKF